MANDKKYLEQEIADDIKDILRREVTKLKNKEKLEGNDPTNLEKYTKIYSILMGSHREDVKHGIFGQMSEEDLEKLLEEDRSAAEVIDEASEDPK